MPCAITYWCIQYVMSYDNLIVGCGVINGKNFFPGAVMHLLLFSCISHYKNTCSAWPNISWYSSKNKSSSECWISLLTHSLIMTACVLLIISVYWSSHLYIVTVNEIVLSMNTNCLHYTCTCRYGIRSIIGGVVLHGGCTCIWSCPLHWAAVKELGRHWDKTLEGALNGIAYYVHIYVYSIGC